MASKAEKLRLKRLTSKTGRPRKEGAERYPSGKIKPTWTEKETRSVAIEARSRVHQLPETADLGKGGYTAGRMHLDGKIPLEFLEAGNNFASRWVTYQRAVGLPSPSARAQSFGQVRGHDGEETDQMQDRATKATNRMMEDKRIILSCSEGPNVLTTVFNLFVLDNPGMREMPPSQLRMLLRGLKALRDAAESKQRQPAREVSCDRAASI